MAEHFDYIVVGGGSSGCVTATRLVRDFGARVLLLEAGPRRSPKLLGMPAGYMKYLASDEFLTMHKSVPQPQLDGRAPIIPQGRLLGGGSAVNAMVYMRGNAADYDGWDRALGQGSGWSYRDLLPHFKGMEDNDHLGGEFHGSGGPLKVSHLGRHDIVSQTYVRTLQALGYPYNPDFNGAHQRGVGFMQHTIDGETRRRCSAADAFLSQVIDDPRLTLLTEATAIGIILENGRAIGVRYRHGRRTEEAFADAEVILTAGSYISPKLLMLSGIGPAAHLGEHGIKVAVDLSGVGANLQDHHEVPTIAALNRPAGYFGQDRGMRMLMNGLQYLLFKTGRVTSTGVESCAFVDPRGEGTEPTVQLYCVPSIYLDRDVSGLTPTHGVTLTACVMRPKARGSVRLRSADPDDPPRVDCNFFGDPDDLALQVAAVRFARQVLKTRPLADLVDRELWPGPDRLADSDIEAHCKRTVKTTYHPVGTCRMGADDDPDAVLDTRLRVRGVAGLRVFDCSMMPRIVTGNTNAPALAIADRAVTLMMEAA
jgi:choline dehydrogenase